MKKNAKKARTLAVQRFLQGENPQAICASLGKSTRWLYKWVARHTPDNPAWCEDRSRKPLISPHRTLAEIEDIVTMVRLSLYNKEVFYGAQAIRWELEDLDVQPLPSIRTINRILSRRDLTHRRTGRYEPKGKAYPELLGLWPNQTHQVDLVGPCYLTGPIRFYSLNAIDVMLNRCALSSPCPQRRHRASWTLSTRFGSAWAFPTTFRWTMNLPSSAVQPIRGEWGRLSASACSMGSISGSSHALSHGAMG